MVVNKQIIYSCIFFTIADDSTNPREAKQKRTREKYANQPADKKWGGKVTIGKSLLEIIQRILVFF